VLPPLTLQGWLRFDAVERLLAGVDGVRTVLEIGAGVGALGSVLARRYDYLGLEPDRASYELARRRIEAAGGRIEPIAYTGLAAGETFDLVCAFEVLEHLSDDAAVLGAWRELVRTGGRLLLSVPAGLGRFGASDELVGHVRRYERSSLVELLDASGFHDPVVRGYGYPLGNVLKPIRDRVAARQLRASGDRGTAVSGRWLQPSHGRLTWAAALPFRYLQRPFAQTELGTGLVALARRG
jgi:2-polyprenyl-3-methyl-5-hydroxy-6-metoxy-1,4-benzoquinol methylase